MDFSGHRAGPLVSLMQPRGWWDTQNSSFHHCQWLQECCRPFCSSLEALAAPPASSNPLFRTKPSASLGSREENFLLTAARLPSLPPRSILTHWKSTGPTQSRYFSHLNTPTRAHTALKNARCNCLSWELGTGAAEHQCSAREDNLPAPLPAHPSWDASSVTPLGNGHLCLPAPSPEQCVLGHFPASKPHQSSNTFWFFQQELRLC